MVTGAGTSLNMPSHVEFNFLTADTSASSHHRIPHAITAGAIHPWVSLIQVTPARVIVPESTGTPGIRGISYARLWTFLVSQSGLGSMEGRGNILRIRIILIRCRTMILIVAPAIVSTWWSRIGILYSCGSGTTIGYRTLIALKGIFVGLGSCTRHLMYSFLRATAVTNTTTTTSTVMHRSNVGFSNSARIYFLIFFFLFQSLFLFSPGHTDVYQSDHRKIPARMTRYFIIGFTSMNFVFITSCRW